MSKITLQREIFKRQGATLPVVQFQKGKYPRSQLTELYQIRVEPIQVRLEGRTLTATLIVLGTWAMVLICFCHSVTLSQCHTVSVSQRLGVIVSQPKFCMIKKCQAIYNFIQIQIIHCVYCISSYVAIQSLCYLYLIITADWITLLLCYTGYTSELHCLLWLFSTGLTSIWKKQLKLVSGQTIILGSTIAEIMQFSVERYV